MTASHSPNVHGLTPLFSTRAGTSADTGVDDDLAEVVEISEAAARTTRAVTTGEAARPHLDPETVTTMRAAHHDDVVDAAVLDEGAEERDRSAPAPSSVSSGNRAVAVRPTTAPLVPVTTEGLPLSLDVFAVATRAVVVLIGSQRPAEQIAKTAIGLSIESEQCAAIDVVVPRAIDLVLQRAKALIKAGIAPSVVDSFEERRVLWSRLSVRSGLEPAAIVLSLAPFPAPMIASMLRTHQSDVELVIQRWHAGVDPIAGEPGFLTPAQIASVSSASTTVSDDPAVPPPVPVVEPEPVAEAPVIDVPESVVEPEAVAETRVDEEAPVVEPIAVVEPEAVIEAPAAEVAAPVAEVTPPPYEAVTGDASPNEQDTHGAPGDVDVAVAAYAAASRAVSTAAVSDHVSGPDDEAQTAAMAMNEDALDAFLALPDGPGSRVRQLLRRFALR